MNNPRLGHIKFLNVLPLTYGFFFHNKTSPTEIIADVPAVVNEKIKNNLLDVSMMSSIEYARQSDNLIMLPDFCVRADGDVTSIILVSRKPIEKLDGENVIITSQSATAHCLLKIILREGYNVYPNYGVRSLNVNELVPDDATAALFIGDDALFIHLHERENFYYYDLGREWKDLTGLQMVYAVFGARKNFVNQYPNMFELVRKKIADSFKYGLENKKAAIDSVVGIKPFTFEELNHYLGGVIKWDLTDDAIVGLQTFYRLANKINLLDNIPAILHTI